VLDAVGDGDGFTAGYLSGVLDGVSPAMALHRGTVTGAFAVARVGHWEGLPTHAELSRLETEPGSAVR
jgi:2-dehydro-3-deoxygluconokinase